MRSVFVLLAFAITCPAAQAQLDLSKPWYEQPRYPTYSQTTAFPVVVFVGIEPRDVRGLESCYEPIGFAATKKPSIIVLPGGDYGERFGTDASDAEIRHAAGLEASRQAVPFGLKSTADGSPWLPSSEQQRLRAVWPEGVPMPSDLAFYRPAQHVQRSAVTDYPQERRYNVLTVSWLTRRSQWPYDVPGGLDRISRSQWQAFPAVSKSVKPRVFEQIDPSATAYGGRLRRFDREFEAGTTFYDLLVNARGEAFELRAMDYQGGAEPEPMVMFADATKAPPGYVRVKSSACMACHADAGSVRYATGNVVGGGHNFSLPFE